MQRFVLMQIIDCLLSHKLKQYKQGYHISRLRNVGYISSLVPTFHGHVYIYMETPDNS